MAGRDDYVCPHCGGSTWVIDDAGDAQPCVCRGGRIRRAQTRGLVTTIPRRFSGLTVSPDGRQITDHGRPLAFAPEIARAVLKYCRTIDEQLERGRGLWFEGDTGTGKTTLAMLVSKSALQAGHSVAIYSMPRLLATIRNTFDADSDSSYAELFKQLTAVDLLHLDDVGAEQQTEWVLEQLYSIVNERYEDGRAVMITTNLGIADLKKQIGERTVSRLMEMCGDALPLYGSDRRVEFDPAKPDPFSSPQDEPTARKLDHEPATD
ncbi:MAG: ATP-binding protein [Actinobacteria bacterium]|nr:ATP-binding protein [Actinomycetota bacterium]